MHDLAAVVRSYGGGASARNLALGPASGLSASVTLPIPLLVRSAVIALAASLPFEAADLGFTSSSFSLAKVSGLLFVASYFFFYNPLSGRRTFPALSRPLRYFLCYFAVLLVHGVFLGPAYAGQYLSMMLTTAQLLLLFWIASSLLQNVKLLRRVLFAFAFSSVALASGMLLQLPGFAVAIESRMGERVTSLDYNPNFLAFSMALAALTLIGLALDGSIRQRYRRWALFAAMLPVLAIIVRTGSRAGFIAFVLGFAVYLAPWRDRRDRKMLAAAALLVLVATAAMIARNPTILTRFAESYAGNIVSRERINAATLDMVLERPLFGWQPVLLWQELGRRAGHLWGTKDAHNSLFHLLLEVGVLGALPFLIGVGLCVGAAWRARNGRLGCLPLALMVCVLVANLAHTYITRKPQWLMLAVAAAAGAHALRRCAPAPVPRALANYEIAPRRI